MISPITAGLILFGLWAIFFFGIPVVIWRAAFRTVSEGDSFWGVISRLTFSAGVFLFLAFLSLLFTFLIVVGPHPRESGDFLGFSDFLYCLIAVLVFGFFGYMSAVVVSERFVNPFSRRFWTNEYEESFTDHDL